MRQLQILAISTLFALNILFSNTSTSGNVTKLTGKSMLFRPNGSQEILKIGSKLNPKDRVKIFPGALLQVKFETGAECLLNSAGVFIIDQCTTTPKGNKTEINMLYGNIKTKVDKLSSGANEFNLITPSVIAGVRGTEFDVSVSADITVLTVVTGTVAVQDKTGVSAPTAVNAGEGVAVKTGESEVKTFVVTTATESSSSSQEVTDRQPPVFIITEPAISGVEVFEPTFELMFTVIEQNLAAVAINGATVRAIDGETVTYKLRLTPGVNRILFFARDLAGNVAEENVLIRYTPIPPTPPNR